MRKPEISGDILLTMNSARLNTLPGAGGGSCFRCIGGAGAPRTADGDIQMR